jgi:hypothetical protein
MLPALLLAAACGAWHGEATGHYVGEVESRGPKAIDTWIEETQAGLSGSYVLHEEARDVTGTLEPLGDEDCDVALFRWTDVYGTGVARLHFHPAAHCFEGTWGLEHTDPVLTWRSCTQSRVTS